MTDPCSSKIPTEHKDVLGVILKVGDKIAVANYNVMEICSVSKLNPKMIKVDIVHKRKNGKETLRVYSNQVVLLGNTEDVLAYVLRGR